jgi:hypothetical protein
LSDSIRHPLISAIAAIIIATTAAWLVRIFRLRVFRKQYAAFTLQVPLDPMQPTQGTFPAPLTQEKI